MRGHSKDYRLVAFSLVAIFATTVSQAAVQLNRQGAAMQLRWQADSPGHWQLLGDRGQICAAGRFSSGPTTLNFNKLPSLSEMQFQYRSDGGQADSIAIPAQVDIHRQPRPDAAVIYQLPVRTYFARDLGPDFSGRLTDLTAERLAELAALGVDYIWLTGILEHASRDNTDADVVKGQAGSYYAVTDNWDISPQVGSLVEFEALVERIHQAGLRVLLDLVANHTARGHRTDVLCKDDIDFGRNDRSDQFFDTDNNYYYLADQAFVPPEQPHNPFADGVYDADPLIPGTQLEFPAKVTGNDISSATPQITDWFETAKLNYGIDIRNGNSQYSPRPRTWDQMLDVATYWLAKGVDGFRVDFAHALPIEFWQYFVSGVRQLNPNVFLLAEAYESDLRMRSPGFTYERLLTAGFDSIYNSELYWSLHHQARHPGNIEGARLDLTPAFRRDILTHGFRFTHYVENHDEVRTASRHFLPWMESRDHRASFGLSLTAYAGLLPGHLLLHGGQELKEDASIWGPYAPDNGRTSIFDYVYQSQTRSWYTGRRSADLRHFRQRYQDLLTLKKQTSFAASHSLTAPSYLDLHPINWHKEQSKWVAAYLRYSQDDVYLVVMNADPFVDHEVTIHFTSHDNHDSHGALTAMGVVAGAQRYEFREVFSRRNWVPSDPAISGYGIPGQVLFRSGNVPSGLYLGQLAAATTYVFKVTPLNANNRPAALHDEW